MMTIIEIANVEGFSRKKVHHHQYVMCSNIQQCFLCENALSKNYLLPIHFLANSQCDAPQSVRLGELPVAQQQYQVRDFMK